MTTIRVVLDAGSTPAASTIKGDKYYDKLFEFKKYKFGMRYIEHSHGCFLHDKRSMGMVFINCGACRILFQKLQQ